MNASVLPNRELLDPNFQSYRLSLKPGFIVTTFESEGIELRSLPQNNFSKSLIQLASLHNCLFQDSFVPHHLYYVTSNLKIKRLVIPHKKEAFGSGQTVFEIPNTSHTDVKSIKCNVSLKFLPSHVILCDGIDNVYLILTSDRLSAHSSPWKVILELKINLDSGSGYLVDALLTEPSENESQIDFVVLSVTKVGDKSTNHVNWFTLSRGFGDFRQTRHRRFQCSTFPDHVAFDGSSSSITVRSNQPLIPLFDTANPNVGPPVKESPKPMSTEASQGGEVKSIARFNWVQSLPTMPEGDSKLLNILIKLSDELRDTSLKISVNIEPVQKEGGSVDVSHRFDITLQTKNNEIIGLCSFRLFAPVKPSCTLWTYDRDTNSIDISLEKAEAGTWPRLLAEYEEEVRLGVQYDDSSLPSTPVSIDEEPMQSCFNVEQLEDVDMAQDNDEDEPVIQKIDGESMKVIVRAEMNGHKMLYSVVTRFDSGGSGSPSHLLCTRYDVDGVIWAPRVPEDLKQPWVHMATLQAFGYVLASKQNRRFVASPPVDAYAPQTPAFVAVADISRHVYVYWQRAPSALTELRHRNSGGGDGVNEQRANAGSNVVHIAWQQVIGLPSMEEIVGFAAVSDEPYACCVVATQHSLYLVCLDEEE